MIRGLVDTIAETILSLRLVAPTQWLLRLVGLVTAGAGIALCAGADPLSNVFSWIVIAAALGLLWQTVDPDSAAGTVALCCGIALLVLAPGPWWRIVPAAILYLAAHVCWSLSALGPSYGVIGRGVLTTGLRWAGVTLLVSGVVGVAVVLPLGLADTPGWALVVGILALVGLTLMVLPRPRRGSYR
jgi:hypothetical protein